MIVYCVDAYDDSNHSREYFATLKEARAWKQTSDENPIDVTITRLRLGRGRAGIVKALNDVLNFYCVNEH
jgi:hypothetical protein